MLSESKSGYPVYNQLSISDYPGLGEKMNLGIGRYLMCAAVVSGCLGLLGCGTPIVVESRPTGADVFRIQRGGPERMGVTPTSVFSGSYELSKEGYVKQSLIVRSDTKSPVQVDLEKEIPKVTIASKPPSAEVYDSDGNLLGQTPIVVSITESSQSYELRKFGFPSKSITLTAESSSRIEIDLGEPIAGMILMEIVVGEKGLEVRSSMVFSEQDVIERSPTVRAVRRLTDFSTTRWVGRFCLFPDNKRLLADILDKEVGADILKAPLYSNLWAMDVAGAGGLQRWTEGGYLDEAPCFSDDGEFVYFGSTRAGKNAIFRMSLANLKGLGMVTPGTTADSYPQISPDGTALMWTASMPGSEIPQLWSLPLNKGLPAGLPMQIREGRESRWSPKGDLVLYTAVDRNIGKTKIWTMTPDGSRPTQLTTGSNYNDVDPCWSPDGSKIIFTSDRGVSNGRQNFDIWIMDADGTNPKQLTTNGSHDDRPIISTDGRTVYFRSNRGLKWDIWVMEIADGGAE